MCRADANNSEVHTSTARKEERSQIHPLSIIHHPSSIIHHPSSSLSEKTRPDILSVGPQTPNGQTGIFKYRSNDNSILTTPEAGPIKEPPSRSALALNLPGRSNEHRTKALHVSRQVLETVKMKFPDFPLHAKYYMQQHCPPWKA